MKLKPFVKVTGQGPNLVLIHGWGLHGGIWETVVPELERSFTVYNIDLPGFGRSPLHNGDYSLDYLVDSILAVMPDKSFLMGWSLGGLVATAITIKAQQKVEGLVTVASNPCFVADEAWKFGMQKSVLESFMDYLHDDYEGTLIRFLGIQTMGSSTQKEDIKRLKEAVFIHGQPAKKALAGGLQILHDINLVNDLEQIKIPMLRLYGRLDSLVPVKVVTDVDKVLPETTSKVYRRSAHAPFLSATDEFIEDVSQFLSAIDTIDLKPAEQKEVN